MPNPVTPRYPRHSQRALAEVLGAGEAGELGAVAADADGSILGRIASIQEQIALLGNIQVAIKNQAIDDSDDLFDVDVGNVKIWALYATCEVDGDQSPVISLLLDADDGVNVVLATGANIAAVNTDDTITITNSVVAINDAGAAAITMAPFECKPGVIESVKDSGTSGAAVLKWHCVWSPLVTGATVAAAA